MSGGVWELTGYINNDSSNLTIYGLSLYNSFSKYKDVYNIGTTDTNENNYTSNSGYYGNTMYEISSSGTNSTSWNSDYSLFVNNNHVFSIRGSFYSRTTNSGIFAFGTNGGVGGNTGFSATLMVQTGL
ncbi:MAG: hypothetical protein ACK5NF_02830 [Bacilli bacterium]